MSQAANLVTAFFRALGTGDFATARTLLAQDLAFQGPFDKFTERDSYLQALERLYPIVKSVKIRKLFEDGADVCVLYDMETNTPIGTVPICECFSVQAGRIGAIEAIFDARPFAPMFSH